MLAEASAPALVFGRGGRLGRFLNLGLTPIIAMPTLRLFEESYESCSLQTLAIQRTTKAIVESGCSTIIYLAGLSRPIDCDRNPALSKLLNVLLPSWLAALANEYRLNFVYASSEYVYDNCSGVRPFDESASLKPQTIYGQHKLDGERAVLMHGGSKVYIFRLGKGIDSSLQSEGIFTDALQNVFLNRPILAATDQFFNPFDVTALGSVVQKIILHGRPGIYNLGSREIVSRFEFLKVFLTESRLKQFQLAKCILGEILGKQHASHGYLGMNTEKLFNFAADLITTPEQIATAAAAYSNEWLSNHSRSKC